MKDVETLKTASGEHEAEPPLVIVLSPNVRNNNPSKPDIRKNFITKSSRVLNTNFSQQIQIPTKYIDLGLGPNVQLVDRENIQVSWNVNLWCLLHKNVRN